MAVDSSKTYHGKSCFRCGDTLRWKGNRNCVRCDRARAAERMRRNYEDLSGPEYHELLLKHRRTKALARLAKRNERSAS